MTWPWPRGNGPIERIARTNTDRLTGDGLTFAVPCNRVDDQGAASLDCARRADRCSRPGPRRLAGDDPTHPHHPAAATRLGRAT